MDAQAYLMRHGWTGPGNPLNANRKAGQRGGLGLARPLLISRRENKLGVGQVSIKNPTNQWWLRGFEEALRGVGTDGSATPSGDDATNTLTRNGSQLYKFFVRGEVIPGTLQDKEKKAAEKKPKDDKKRKRDRDDAEKRKEEKKKKKRKTDELKGAETDREVRKAKKEKKEKRSKKENLLIEEDASPSGTLDTADSTELKRTKQKKRREESEEQQDTDAEKKADKRKKKKREKKEALLTEDDQSSVQEGVKTKEKKEKKKSSRSDKKSKEKKRKKDEDS